MHNITTDLMALLKTNGPLLAAGAKNYPKNTASFNNGKKIN